MIFSVPSLSSRPLLDFAVRGRWNGPNFNAQLGRLSKNRLKGSIPEFLGSASQLLRVDFNDNSLLAEVPLEVR